MGQLTIFKHFILIFLPVTVPVGLVIAISHISFTRGEKKILEIRETHTVALRTEVMERTFQAVRSDLMFLSEQYNLAELLVTPSPLSRKILAGEYFSFSGRKMIYDQIRFLDETGMERIRINFNQGQPVIVPDKDLQPKAERYYFKETLKRKKNEIQVSAFDLNVEKGIIEQPPKPTIRFGTPVFDVQGRKRGMVILNYLGAELLGQLEKFSPDAAETFLLANTEGYWLVGPTAADHWSAVYPDRKNRTVERSFPEVWPHLRDHDSGQVYTPQGLFTFRKILLTGFTRQGRNETRLFGLDSWTIISHVSRDFLKEKNRGFLFGLLLVYAILTLVLLSISWHLARVRVRKKVEIRKRNRAEEHLKMSLKEKEILLKEVHHRVKNNLQVISSLLKLQARYIRDPDTLAIFRESRGRIRAISFIHEILYQSDDLANIPTRDYLERLLGNLFVSYGVDPKQITSAIEVFNLTLKVEQGISCGLIINELVSNSLKHAFPDGREGHVSVALDRHVGDRIRLTVSDNGVGFSQPPELSTTQTMGLRLVRFMVEELEGTIHWEGTNGTRFQIYFPEDRDEKIENPGG